MTAGRPSVVPPSLVAEPRASWSQLPHTNLVSCFRSQFKTRWRTFTFLRESGHHIVEEITTFGDLDRGAREIAAWLGSRPEAERPVLLLFEPGVQFWRAFLGCLYAGVTPVPAHFPHDEPSIARVAAILRDAGAGLALTTADLDGVLAAGLESLGTERPTLCVATDAAPLADPETWTMPRIAPDAVAFLQYAQYASGSTGDQNRVAVTHADVLNNLATIAEAIQVISESVIVGCVPHFHDMGLVSGMLAFFAGANLVSMAPAAFQKQPVRMLQAISDHRGTHAAAPNAAYDLIARRVTPGQLTGLDLSPWEAALTDAEPVRHRTVERIIDLLSPAGFLPTALRRTYGMAEMTP